MARGRAHEGGSYTAGLAGRNRYIGAATRRDLISRYGEVWVAALPAIMERLAHDHGWKVLRRLTGGRTACVLLVHTGTRTVVVKVTPDVAKTAREVAALEVLSSYGVAPKVLEQWVAHEGGLATAVLMLEVIGNGTSLIHQPSRPVTMRAMADMLRAVRNCGAVPLSVSLESLRSYLEGRLDKPVGGGPGGSRPPTPAEVSEAKGLLSQLLSGPQDGRWVHGTLHPGNLIASRDAILTIDPRPFRGEHEYDVAELAIKWGSIRNLRDHNLADGLQLWRELRPYMDIDEERLMAWMRVILATGV